MALKEAAELPLLAPMLALVHSVLHHLPLENLLADQSVEEVQKSHCQMAPLDQASMASRLEVVVPSGMLPPLHLLH